MPAYVTAIATIKEPARFQSYLSALPKTLTPFGGEVICRGKVMKALHGEPDFQLVATIAFPDVSTAESWYQSPAYQALIQNRDEALDSTIVLIA